MRITIIIEGKRASITVETEADLVEAEPIEQPEPEPSSEPSRLNRWAEP